MQRTHIYLTDEQTQAITIRALQEKKSKAEIVRDIVDHGLKATTIHKRQSAGQALLDLATLGEELGMHGPTDLSTRHD